MFLGAHQRLDFGKEFDEVSASGEHPAPVLMEQDKRRNLPVLCKVFEQVISSNDKFFSALSFSYWVSMDCDRTHSLEALLILIRSLPN